MQTQRPQVLLVDDDPLILRVMTKSLEAAGYEVRTASDGDDALEQIQSRCPHYLVTDWEMPRMDGEELCRRVRAEKLPNYVYILFLTAHGTSEHTIRGLEAGADDFLTKPVIRAELLARLRSGERVLELERRLSDLARTDTLTGIATRRAFYEQFDRELSRAARYHLPLSCVMIDVDYFKKVNDLYGHPVGDAVLKEVAALLERSVRASDYLCRYGGEEFCVLLTETTDIAARVWSERVRRAIADLKVPAKEGHVRLTASFGVSQLLEDAGQASQLIDQADQALLVAKQSGRDRVIVYRSLCDSTELNFSPGLGDPFAGVQARNVMTTLVACLDQNETLGRAADFFLRFRINSSPVVDERGKLVGILSEKDVMSVMLAHDSWNRPVRDIMKTNVVCYQEQTPIKTIFDFLCRVTIRRVIIVNDGFPTGLISRGTLLRWFNNWLAVHGRPSAAAPQSAADCRERRKALQQSAAALLELAARLQASLSDDAEDAVPVLIDSTSRMQELINDLLADSRSFVEPSARPIDGALPRCAADGLPSEGSRGAMAMLAAMEGVSVPAAD